MTVLFFLGDVFFNSFLIILSLLYCVDVMNVRCLCEGRVWYVFYVLLLFFFLLLSWIFLYEKKWGVLLLFLCFLRGEKAKGELRGCDCRKNVIYVVLDINEFLK